MNKRIKELQKILIRDGVDAACYSTSPNLQYFLDDVSFRWERTPYTGFVFNDHNGHQESVPDCILYIPADDEPVLFTSYKRAEDMQHIAIRQITGFFCNMPQLMEGIVKGKKIAVGEACDYFIKETIAEFLPDCTFCDAEEYGNALRAIKDEKEIAVIRELCKFTDYSMAETVKILKPGISNAEVENYINKLGYDYGCREMPFPPTVRFYHTGHESEDFHVDGWPSRSILKEGSSISFDYGFTKNGYCTDFGRSFYSGKAPQHIKDAYKHFQEAQVKVIERMKPGDPMTYGFDMILDHMKKYDLDRYVRHYYDFDLLGHQVGISVHEGPWLHNRQEAVLKPGMIFTVEPKFWWPGQCFMRIEDMILITENGSECLTNFDRDLFELPTD